MAGRKLSFDPDVALEQMMRVFWQQGYAATSVDDLCRAVGVPKPSLYSYFGDKEQILIQALQLFSERAPQRSASLHSLQRTFKERLTELMLSTSYRGLCDGPSPAGCFQVNMTAEFMGSSRAIDETLVKMNELNEDGLTKFFEQVRERGEVRKAIDPKMLARQVNTFIKGLAISRKGGTSAKSLREQTEFFIEMIVATATRKAH